MGEPGDARKREEKQRYEKRRRETTVIISNIYMIPQHVFVGEKEATLITLYWSPSRHFYTWCRI
jgi:hypothetical protein